jgi:hypothetical protein
MRYSVLIIALLAITGCATKNYGRQGTLTDFEKQTMSCREIDLETAKVHGFLDHVDKESQFDGRSVLAFLGDFGIGNVMEKDSAINSANQRLMALDTARTQKGCSAMAAQPATSASPSLDASPAMTTRQPVRLDPRTHQPIGPLESAN